MNKDTNFTPPQKYFPVANFYTAVFFLVKGLYLVNIENQNGGRSNFIFLDSPEREEILRNFNFAKENSPEVLVDARQFIATIKLLKDKLYLTNPN